MKSKFLVILYSMVLALTVFSPAGEIWAMNPYGIRDDAYIVIQQQKADLEYRIKRLETQSFNSPGVTALTIESRINELERQRDAEKRYIEGVLAHNGVANQIASKLAEIDVKYQSRIDALREEKRLYERSSTGNSSSELRELRLQLQSLERKLEAQNELIDQMGNRLEQASGAPDATTKDFFLYLANLEDKDKAAQLFALLKSANPAAHEDIFEMAEEKYMKPIFGDVHDPERTYAHISSMPLSEAKPIIDKLQIFNPDLVGKWSELARTRKGSNLMPTNLIKNTPQESSENIQIQKTIVSTSSEIGQVQPINKPWYIKFLKFLFVRGKDK